MDGKFLKELSFQCISGRYRGLHRLFGRLTKISGGCQRRYIAYREVSGSFAGSCVSFTRISGGFKGISRRDNAFQEVSEGS